MTNDPELKAMSEVLDALQDLDTSTRTRVVDWVLAKLGSNSAPDGAPIVTKRGPKPGKKRGPKPGSKRKGKRGRPPGVKIDAVNTTVTKSKGRRGRPRKFE